MQQSTNQNQHKAKDNKRNSRTQNKITNTNKQPPNKTNKNVFHPTEIQ